jgi:WD40 repeat protein
VQRGETKIGIFSNTHAFHLLESPDSKQLVVVGSFEKAYVIGLDEVKILKEFPMSLEHAPATFALADNGATLVRMDRSLAVTHYDLTTGKVKEQEKRPKVPEGLGVQGRVYLAPDGKTYATGDGKLRDFATHELRYEIKLDTKRRLQYRNGTYRPLFSDESKLVALNGSDGSVRIVDVESGKELRNIRFEEPERPRSSQERIISPLALSGNGRWLLVGGDQAYGDYQLFGVASGLEVRRFPGNPSAPFWNSFALSATGEVLVLPKLSNLELWDTAKAEPKPKPSAGK